MYVNRTEDRLPRVESGIKRLKPKAQESFSETMDSVLTADAVDLTLSKEKYQGGTKQDLGKRQERKDRKPAEADNGPMNVSA